MILRKDKQGNLITFEAKVREKDAPRMVAHLVGGPRDGQQIICTEGALMLMLPDGIADTSEELSPLINMCDYYRTKSGDFVYRGQSEQECPI